MVTPTGEKSSTQTHVHAVYILARRLESQLYRHHHAQSGIGGLRPRYWLELNSARERLSEVRSRGKMTAETWKAYTKLKVHENKLVELIRKVMDLEMIADRKVSEDEAVSALKRDEVEKKATEKTTRKRKHAT